MNIKEDIDIVYIHGMNIVSFYWEKERMNKVNKVDVSRMYSRRMDYWISYIWGVKGRQDDDYEEDRHIYMREGINNYIRDQNRVYNGRKDIWENGKDGMNLHWDNYEEDIDIYKKEEKND